MAGEVVLTVAPILNSERGLGMGGVITAAAVLLDTGLVANASGGRKSGSIASGNTVSSPPEITVKISGNNQVKGANSKFEVALIEVLKVRG